MVGATSIIWIGGMRWPPQPLGEPLAGHDEGREESRVGRQVAVRAEGLGRQEQLLVPGLVGEDVAVLRLDRGEGFGIGTERVELVARDETGASLRGRAPGCEHSLRVTASVCPASVT